GLRGSQDGFFLAYRVIDSNEQPRISITTRLTGLVDRQQPLNQNACAGVMIRKFDEDAKIPSLRYAAMVITAGNDALFLRRLEDGTDSTRDGPVIAPPPCWLRLSCEPADRSGFLNFQGEMSRDGKAWKMLSTV